MVRRMRSRLLPRHHDRQPVHDGDHHPLVGGAALLKRIPPAPLLVGHRPGEDGAPLVARVGDWLSGARGWSMALGSLQQPHHVRLDGVRLAGLGGRLRLVLVGLRVGVMPLRRHCVPHVGRNHVGEALDGVGCVDLVPGHTGHFVHHGTFSIPRFPRQTLAIVTAILDARRVSRAHPHCRRPIRWREALERRTGSCDSTNY